MPDAAAQSDGSLNAGKDPVSYWRIFKTWLPLGMTQFLMAAEDPLYVAVIMRLQFPKLELGALYSYMWPILLLISSAVFTLVTVGNVFATNVHNLRKIKTLSFTLGAVCTLMICVFAFTPLGRLFMLEVMAIPNSELDMALNALKICSIYPVVAAMNQIYQGTLIRSGRALHVFLARTVRFGAGLAVLLVGLKTSWASGAVLGAVAITLSLLLQTIYLWWKSRICTTRLKENPLETEVVKTSALIRFTIPLSITPILGSITGLVMAAAIGRLPGVVVSLAIWPVVTNFNNIGLGMGQSYDQVTVKHYASNADRKRLMKFGVILGILLSIITALFIVSGVFHYALRSLENLDENNSKISINAMWFLTAMPFLYTMVSYYSGLLAKSMKTIPILISQTFSLLLVTLMLLATINLEPFMGVYVVSAASVVASGVSVLWLWYSWRKMIPHLSAGV